jgi:exodeoxyribonuclease V gamma subunit
MLYVHRSERADRLVEILGDLLTEPLTDPMTAEIVAVPTRGVERWLAQRLSHRLGAGPDRADGVCANVAFPFPGALINATTAAAIGIPADADPWLPERSVWPLLELIDIHLDEPFLLPLAAHLRAASPAGAGRPDGAVPQGAGLATHPSPAGPRRFATVRHLADLYDHYSVHRPEMIMAWAAGLPEVAAATTATTGTTVTTATAATAVTAAWQAELWRRLRRRIGVESPAERIEQASTRVAESAAVIDLPPRLSLFGLTRLPASHLLVLRAVAAWRDVHLFLLHPSAPLWDKVASRLPRPPAAMRRADDPTASLPDNPLLRSWGRDAREMQLVLAAHGTAAGEYRGVAETSSTLLHRIQADVRADRAPPLPPRAGDPDPRPLLDPADRSVRVHSCHGRSRQVEVMRDAVLRLLAADTSLEPRDVIIMCPDIETFAPLVHAAFGGGDRMGPGEDPGQARPGDGAGDPSGGSLPQLRVRLADRSILQTNPLLAVADFLLELAGSRVTASQVLDLVSREPVRRRFHFDEDGQAQLERWVASAGIRWGLDGDHRAPWGLPGLEVNSWSAGVDRLLLGVAMADDDQRLFAGTLPLDDVVSATVDLAGHAAELIDRLGAAVDALSHPQSIKGWRDAIARATESLAAAAPADGWQRDQLYRVLDEVVDEAGAAASSTVLDLSEARSLLAERLKGRPTRANFRTGDLTVCTLVPMRSVPHRVVGLLGLDDGVFPRHTHRDGDNLLSDDPHVGDRDARSEDRQLLLDAVLAATDHLVITFSGRDERTNRDRPPAVPIAELLDVVDRTVRIAGDPAPARQRVLVQHPLQSFDPRNFGPRSERDGTRSFDPVSLDGAVALTAPRQGPRPFLAGCLPPLGGEVVQLESLVRFVEHPVKAFLRERLGWYAGSASDEVDDSLPIDLDPLERWEVGDRLLAARLAGADLSAAVSAERARGILPPGRLVDAVLSEVTPTVEALVDAAGSLPCASAEARSLDVNVRLPDGRVLIGTVAGVRDGIIVRSVYSRLAPKHRLAAWVRFLALSAAWPDQPIASVLMGRGARGPGGRQLIRTSVLPPLAAGPSGSMDGRPPAALAGIGVLVDLYDRGMREPLPIYCDTSAAWTSARRAGDDPGEAALGAWKSAYEFPREDCQPEHVMVLGGVVPFEALLTATPPADERGPGWDGLETSRFGCLARRIWDPLLAHEQMQDR